MFGLKLMVDQEEDLRKLRKTHTVMNITTVRKTFQTKADLLKRNYIK